MNIRLNKILAQVVVLFFLSVFLAVGFNSIRKNGLSFWERNTSHTSDFSVSISVAKRFFFKKKALFIDARPKEFYKRSHIKGAINIPPESEEELIKRIRLPKDKVIITYCDDRTCGLSKELALELYSLGFDNVYYLKEGFKAWLSQNLPVEEHR